MVEKKEYTILAIDDNPVNLRMLCFILQTQGYNVLQTDKGRNGLELARKKLPDLILLDISMPDMDGYEVCQHLKSDPLLKSIPVLMVSVTDEVKAKVRCFELGAADYITKPYNKDEIFARIQTHLHLRQLTRNLEDSHNMLVEKQHMLDQDLKVAAVIQKALLPHKFPDVKTARFSFTFLPCERIAGDLFNVQILDDEHLGIYVLDVSGHGVPAAMLTALVHQLMLPQSGKVKEFQQEPPYYRLPSPAKVFDLLEDELSIDRFDRYLSMVYLVLHLPSGRFTYSCAGHPPILQISPQGEVIRHHRGGSMIGIDSMKGLREEGEGQLKKGDRLFFYTDGIIDNENSQGHAYGMERLEQFLIASRDLDIDTLSAQLMENLAAFSEKSPFQDDITSLVMDFCG